MPKLILRQLNRCIHLPEGLFVCVKTHVFLYFRKIQFLGNFISVMHVRVNKSTKALDIIDR